MMITSGQKSLSTIGFLTITREAAQGLFGGYLVLNTVGRPLEFHCTAPVRPSRAQEILYGPTLDPFLCGECIGPTLLEKSKTRATVVLTDIQPAMVARHLVDVPMVLVAELDATDPADSKSHARNWSLYPPPRPEPAGDPLRSFEKGPYQLAVDGQHPEDEAALMRCWDQFADRIDLMEPFGRIHEAIDEARRAGERMRA